MVHLSYIESETLIECTSDANPDVLVEDYEIKLNGIVFQGPTAVVQIVKKTKITCTASNREGTGSVTITAGAAGKLNKMLHNSLKFGKLEQKQRPTH